MLTARRAVASLGGLISAPPPVAVAVPRDSGRLAARRLTTRRTLATRGDVGRGGSAGPDGVVDPVTDLGQALDHEAAHLGERGAARRALTGPGLGQGSTKHDFRPPEVTPGMAIGPADLARGGEQGAVLQDSQQEPESEI